MFTKLMYFIVFLLGSTACLAWLAKAVRRTDVLPSSTIIVIGLLSVLLAIYLTSKSNA